MRFILHLSYQFRKKIQELGRIFKNFLIKFHVFLSIYLYNTI